MKRYLLGITFLTATTCGLWAGDHVVAATDFEKTTALEGTLLPEGTMPFRLEPEEWEAFPILEAVPQGAAVKEGAAVVVIDTHDLDRRLSDEKEGKRIRDLDLAAAKRDLADSEILTPRALQTSKRGLQRAQEDAAYFKKVARTEKIAASKRSVRRTERALEYQTEELTQLLKMYEEDDLTEETEEIILKRQRTAVDDGKESLKRAKIASKKFLETDLPREAEDLKVRLEAAEQDWSTKKESLPRALRKKQLEVKKMIEDHARSDQRHADLLKDRALMEITAPATGWIYHGEIAEGRWSPGQTSKYLKRGGSLPSKTNFATLVPAGAEMRVHSAASEGQVRELKVGQKGYFAPASAPRNHLATELLSVASHPNLSGTYPVVFKLLLSGEPAGLVPGMKGKTHLITTTEKDVLTVPSSALIAKNDGSFAVTVKAAEEGGEGEERAIEVGPESEGKIVVTSGLTAGEVILTTEAEPAK